MKRIHPSKRAFVRRFPAPPPTPEGMVWYANRLVSAEAARAAAAVRMQGHDEKFEKKLAEKKARAA